MRNKNIIDIAFYSEWDDIRPWKTLLRKKGFNLLSWPKEIKNSEKLIFPPIFPICCIQNKQLLDVSVFIQSSLNYFWA